MSWRAFSPRELAEVALGRKPADLLVVNSRLVNVYTGEVLDGQSVAAKGGRIAYVGPDVPAVADTTRLIDAGGRFLIPGFIDGHTHLDWFCTVDEFLRAALPRGTTTVFTEMSSLADGLGFEGILQYLGTMADQPAKVLGLAPAISLLNAPRFGGRRSITIDEMERLLDLEQVAGVGEVTWSLVLEQDEDAARLIAKARACGKVVEGHTAGARGGKLAASAAWGLSSCHEPISEQQVLDRVRLGLHTMLREGSVRRDLESTVGVVAKLPDSRRLTLVSDSLFPIELRRFGHMDHVVQRAIDLGADPVKVIQMASLNAAEYFGLDDHIGGLAPGRCADLQILPDLKTIRPAYVVSNGNLVAEDGRLLVDPTPHEYPAWMRKSIALPRPMQAVDFAMTAPVGRNEVAVRAIRLCDNVLTEEVAIRLAVKNGLVMASPDRDALKVALVDRRSGARSLAFATGCGLRKGALATSITFDGCQLAVIGARDEDLAGAVNRLAEIQGGLVLWSDGAPVAEIVLPIGGAIGEQSLHELAAISDYLRDRCAALGSTLPNPLLSLITITFTGVPALRLRPGGLLDVRKGALVSVFLEGTSS